MPPIFQRRFPLALAAFLLGVAFRAQIFFLPPIEMDERMYLTLAEQLASGARYTLQGTPLLRELSGAMYDAPTFFHPPLGPALFALGEKLAGVPGAIALQLVFFAMFFWSILFIARRLLPDLTGPSYFYFALLTAFTPIFAHTNMKLWIDNPRVALFTLHFLFALIACEKGGLLPWGLAAATALLPVLTKVDSLTAYPFAYAVAFLHGRRERKDLALLASFTLLALAFSLWWISYSEALRHGPGRPSEDLVKGNFFIWYITVRLSSAQFLLEYAQIIGSLLPACLVVLAGWLAKRERGAPLRAPLFLWIAAHAALYASLGAFGGYSKLHRFLSMATPACLLLFACALTDLPKIPRSWLVPCAALLVLGAGLELAQGVRELVYYPKFALIFPILTGVPE